MCDRLTAQTAGFQIRSCAEDHRFRLIDSSGKGLNPGYPLLIQPLRFCLILRQQSDHLRLFDRQMFLVLEDFSHFAGILRLVSLSSEGVDSRTF